MFALNLKMKHFYQYINLLPDEIYNEILQKYGSMKSSRLADALRGAQEDIIKTRMAGGEDFGKMMKAIKK